MSGGHATLVTGGAGYVGSHVLLALAEEGFDATVLDDLSTGRRDAVRHGRLVVGDAGDAALVGRLMREGRFRSVVHLAGSVVVPESVREPVRYYRNNTAGSLELIRASLEHGVRNFLFSSTAAVYGAPDGEGPIGEDAPTEPLSPYGRSKLATEWMLADAAAAGGMAWASLRYFNVAGAHVGGLAGQSSPVATHLIKTACEAALGKRDGLVVFGDDYPTPDGTCVRDYVHVDDLARAHVAAIRHLDGGGAPLTANCGYGRGFSVREVVEAVREASGSDFPVSTGGRREGDPPSLVAGNGRIRETLGWSPRHDDLGLICRTALEWERSLPPREGGAAWR